MKQQYTHKLTVLVCLVCTALFLFSCKANVEERSTLTLSMETEAFENKSITPSGESLQVSRYMVSGEGPDNSHFSNLSTKSSITVSGLLIGEWTIHAIGQNANGVNMVEGSTTLQLKPEPTTATVILNTLKGTGTIDLTINWDENLISNPSFELTITNQNGTVTVPTLDTTTLRDGYIHFVGNTFSAGSYQVSGKLLSGTQKTAGFAEAVRVLDGLSSTAEISLNLNKTNELPSTITLVNNLGTPVECTISGLEPEMAAGVSATAAIETSSAEDLTISWFLDGEEVGNGLSYTFTPDLGTHRLDVIAKGTLPGSTGSGSIEFNAVVRGTEGVPVFMKQVNDGTQNLHIGGATQLAFLPDGKLIIWSGTHQTLQICQMNRNDLQVLTNYSANNCDFTLTDIADIAVDTARNYVYIGDNNGPKVTKYQYNSTNATLTKICESNNHVWEPEGTYTGTIDQFVRLGHISVDQSNGRVYLSIPSSGQNFTTVYKPSGNTTGTLFQECGYYWDSIESLDKSQTMLPTSFESVLLSSDWKYLVAVDTVENLLLVSNRHDESLTLNAWPVSTFHNGLSGMDGILTACVMDDTTVLVGTQTGITMLTGNLAGSSSWSNGDIYISGDTELGGKQIGNVIQAEQNPAKDKAYFLCTGSHNLLTCAYANKQLSYLGEMQFGTFSPNEMTISDDGSIIILTSNTSNALWILRIPGAST